MATQNESEGHETPGRLNTFEIASGTRTRDQEWRPPAGARDSSTSVEASRGAIATHEEGEKHGAERHRQRFPTATSSAGLLSLGLFGAFDVSTAS